MNDSWLDEALRSLKTPPPSRRFTEETLARLQLRRKRRVRRAGAMILAASGITFGFAVALVWVEPSPPPVAATELASIRAELSALRSQLEEAPAHTVDLDRLLESESSEGVVDALFAAEGGQL
ncbi:MAG: hypothetical protein AAF654_01845 [Myxococcota bacterium]